MKTRMRGLPAAVLLALTLVGCHDDDPGAPSFTPDDPESDDIVVAKHVFIPGSDKPVVRFYEWVPPEGGWYFDPGRWEMMDHPPPGVGAGAAAAATSPGGTSLSGAAAFPGSGLQSVGALAGPNLGLFTGGQSASGDPSSTLAYVYDLLTDDFTVTSLGTARSDHEMTTLLDGRILVTGGFGPPSASVTHASAEMFDPTTGAFSPAGDMHQPRGFHQATLLTDGRVLVTGATFLDPQGWVNTAEVFNPASGDFTPLAQEPANRWDRHAAVRLGDGRVLLIGGHESDRSELFDPVSNTFSPGPDLNTVHGYGLSATLLVDGRVLVVGGVEAFGGIPTAVAEVYDPVADAWTLVEALSTTRRNHIATLGADGSVLIAGGQNEEDGFLTSSEFFDPLTASFRSGPELPVEMVGGRALALSR